MLIPSHSNSFQSAHADLLMRTFREALGLPLIQNKSAKALYHAPFPVLSHNTAADPILTYGNLAAQKLWEMDWDAFTQMPSRLTAEPDEREARAALLATITDQGYIDNYSGVRISSTGRRFYIENAIIWTLLDDQGQKQGQAATFDKVEYL